MHTNLNNIARYDKGQVQGEISITDEGYIKGRAIVTRCGVFLYKNADGTIRKELRHPDDVLQPETMLSMKMIPIVNGHPTERLVNADNAKRLSVGYTGEEVEENMPYIMANMVITDKSTVNEIKNKKKNELSLGYTVDLIEESGMYYGEPYDFRQTNIRYNHLALVDEARAGPQAKIVLDGNDAVEILQQEAEVADKKLRKVKIDAEEYMLEDKAAEGMEGLMKKHEELKKAHEDLKGRHMAMKDAHEKMMAERDSMRDKDHHDPEAVHHPLEEEQDGEFPHPLTHGEHVEGGKARYKQAHATEKDEIGTNGKEEHDPSDSYGMQSHVRDYEKPSSMENHVVESPKNKHYPHDLPHTSKVDSAEAINQRVNHRVKLVRLSEKYLDRQVLSRLDSYSDIDIKKELIKALQPKCDLRGKSDVYINARFDAALEDAPQAKVIAMPSSFNSDSEDDDEKNQANANSSRKNMIKRMQKAYKGGK